MRIGTVVTTIQSPTPSLFELSSHLEKIDEDLYIIGDQKSPKHFSIPFGRYFSPEDQLSMSWKIVAKLPWNSYSRKIIGYLIAASEGYDYIRETDDDNSPLSDFFNPIPQILETRIPVLEKLWVNPYAYFSKFQLVFPMIFFYYHFTIQTVFDFMFF